ncbi:predicted protein [Uncinocarpus reesii 1704]|uniref:Uncharacterized protein n=1 Tax=Uncinocarpus reesii (strain UAMH 1704) TaxID=336963 RepID=C4JE72_UNCRE|nr:uncharacterized protein UREG_00496 [Uncinocarpus reesii 1704]EEP75650.1 predicted protein [Uncinocarpus reesii 1704]
MYGTPGFKSYREEHKKQRTAKSLIPGLLGLPKHQQGMYRGPWRLQHPGRAMSIDHRQWWRPNASHREQN